MWGYIDSYIIPQVLSGCISYNLTKVVNDKSRDFQWVALLPDALRFYCPSDIAAAEVAGISIT
jgi:hypothetical protein